VLQAGPLEQLALGVFVGLHVTVEIQVITGEIGEQGDIDVHAVHAALGQPMEDASMASAPRGPATA
jgi:hypothetical protein